VEYMGRECAAVVATGVGEWQKQEVTDIISRLTEALK